MNGKNRLSEKISTTFYHLTRLTNKKADHEKLNRYIVALNQETLPVEIIKQGAACLKEILKYKLFAFVIQNDDRIDVWF